MMHKMGQSQDVNVMGMMKKMARGHVHMGMGMMMKMVRGRVHMGMMGMMRVGKVHRIKRMHKGAWTLVKNNDGNCECKRGNVKKGKIILGRFHSIKDCETHRGHDC